MPLLRLRLVRVVQLNIQERIDGFRNHGQENDPQAQRRSDIFPVLGHVEVTPEEDAVRRDTSKVAG